VTISVMRLTDWLKPLLRRLTYGLRFYPVYIFILSSATFKSSLNGTQPKPAACSEVSAIWNACPKFGVSPPAKKGDRKAPTSTFTLTANLAANIFRTKHDIDDRVRAWEATKNPYNVPKFQELWPTNAENRTLISTHHP